MPHTMLHTVPRMALMLMLCTQIHAAETVIKCPQRVRMESGKVADSDTPPRFRSAITLHGYLVQAVNAYDGPPENETLIKARESRTSLSSRKIWTFNSPHGEGKWLTCDYGVGMVRLTTRLGDDVRQCTGTIKYQGDPSLPQAEFRCE